MTMSFLPISSLIILFYVGTYTQGESEGIYLFELDLETGAVTGRGLAAESVNPSFLAIHPSQKLLYAVNETVEWKGEETGAVSSFSIDPGSGALSLINKQASLGGAPCYLVVDQSGRHVLVANYVGGSIASLPINQNGGLGDVSSLVQHEGSSINPDRQQGPHAHSINLDGNNRYAVAADLGLDQLLIYPFDAEDGSLSTPPSAIVSLAPGAGPRHLAFHPAGSLVFVVNELDLTITSFSYDAEQGEMSELETVSTIPTSVESGFSTAEILVHQSGKFLYASNRGHDSIAVFEIDQDSGKLAAVEFEPTQGRTPRNFRIDPTGRFLLAANQNSNTIVVFSIDQDTGALSPTGHSVEVPAPVSIKFLEPN